LAGTARSMQTTGEPQRHQVTELPPLQARTKGCFGNRSVQGELAIARLPTVAETCDVQHLNILA
jgi:hypothetical protein